MVLAAFQGGHLEGDLWDRTAGWPLFEQLDLYRERIVYIFLNLRWRFASLEQDSGPDKGALGWKRIAKYEAQNINPKINSSDCKM